MSVTVAFVLLLPVLATLVVPPPAAGNEPSRAVMLLLDGSGSISPAQWRLQLDGFQSAIADEAVVARDGSIDVGVVQWSGNTARVEIPLTNVGSRSDASRLMGELAAIPQIGGLTNPGDGIRTGTDHLVGEASDGSDWTLCLSTDGVTNSGESLGSATTYAVGEGVDRLSVLGIADAGVSAGALRRHYEPHLIGDGTFTVATDTPDFAGLAVGCFVDPVRVTALEVTQGLQDWNGSMPLIEGRETVARAFVETFDGSSQAVTGRLHGVRNGTALPDSPLTPENVNGRTIADGDAQAERVELRSSLNFALPDAWTEGDVDLELELPSGGSCDLASVACPLPSTRTTFQSAEGFDLKMLAVAYEDDDGAVRVPSAAELAEQIARVRSGNPFSDVEADVGALSLMGRFNPVGPPTTEAGWIALLGLVDVARTADRCFGRLCDTYYYAALEGSPSGTIGYGSTQRAAGGYLMGLGRKTSSGHQRNLVNHELGHALGQDHAVHSSVSDGSLFTPKAGFCGEIASPIAPDWPHLITTTTGETRPALGPQDHPATEIWGFDTRFADRQVVGTRLAVVDPTTEFALMSYCRPLAGGEGGQGRWQGQFTWERILERYDGPTTTASAETTGGALLLGAADADGSGIDIDMAIPMDAVEVGGGDHVATGRAADGTVLGEWAFDVTPGAPHSDEEESMSLVRIPAPGLDLDDLDSLEMRLDGNVVEVIEVPPGDARAEAVNATASDDLLTVDWDGTDPGARYVVQLSRDDGGTWSIVGLGDHEGARVATTMLPGGSQQLRVVTSNGIAATVSETIEVTLPTARPSIVVDGPDEDRVYVGHQRLRARATAFAPGEGALGDDRITWSSDLDGSLATGSTLDVDVVGLSEGRHVIEVTATDAAGTTASDRLSVVVSRAPTVDVETSPRERLELLRDDVQAHVADGPSRRSFVAKLAAAIAAIDRDRDAQACGPIGAFIGHVRAQEGAGLDVTTAEDWADRATVASNGLDC